MVEIINIPFERIIYDLEFLSLAAIEEKYGFL